MYKVKIDNEFEIVDYETACAYKGIKPIYKPTKHKLQSCRLSNDRFKFRWIKPGMNINESSPELTAAYVEGFYSNGGNYKS